MLSYKHSALGTLQKCMEKKKVGVGKEEDLLFH